MHLNRRAIVLLTALLMVIAVTIPSVGADAWTLYQINPCTTDANIDCESDSNCHHDIFTPTSPARNELAVFFPGTGAGGNAYDSKWGQAMASHGYHVIILNYNNDVGTAGLCNSDHDADCFRKYRHEVVYGAGVTAPDGSSSSSSHVTVDKDNSVMNRLLKLINYLATTSPYNGQDWDQFQNSGSYNSTYGAYNLYLGDVVVGGHSQGSGVALYMGKALNLEGIAMFSGPQDAKRNNSPNWITEGGFSTSMSSVYGFAHTSDSWHDDQINNWSELGLSGSLTSVDGASKPFSNSHQLKTSSSALPGCPFLGYNHNIPVVGNCTPGTPSTFIPVWEYMYDGP